MHFHLDLDLGCIISSMLPRGATLLVWTAATRATTRPRVARPRSGEGRPTAAAAATVCATWWCAGAGSSGRVLLRAASNLARAKSIMALSPEELEAFESDGFLMRRAVFTAEQIQCISRVARADPQVAEAAAESAKQIKLWADLDESSVYAAVAQQRGIVAPVSQMLGGAAVEHYHHKLIMKQRDSVQRRSKHRDVGVAPGTVACSRPLARLCARSRASCQRLTVCWCGRPRAGLRILVRVLRVPASDQLLHRNRPSHTGKWCADGAARVARLRSHRACDDERPTWRRAPAFGVAGGELRIR